MDGIEYRLDEVSGKVWILYQKRSDQLSAKEVSEMNSILFAVGIADLADDPEQGMIIVKELAALVDEANALFLWKQRIPL